MPGLNEMRDEALSKYDDDLNEIEAPEGMHEMPDGEMMADADMPGMEEEAAAPMGGPDAMISSMLSEVGIQASPEQVAEFMSLLQGAAEEAMAAEGGAMEAEGAEMGAEMAEEPMV